MKKLLLSVSLVLSSVAVKAVDIIPSYGELFTPSTSTLSVKPVGDVQTPDHWGQVLTVSIVTPEDAAKIFAWLQASNLPFLYPKDCCHSRAYLMDKWLEERGIHAAKIFIVAPNVGDLEYHSPYPIYGVVPWSFHVAPALKDPQGGWIILDPSTQAGAVSLASWEQSLVVPGKTVETDVVSPFVYGDGMLSDSRPLHSWDQQLLNIAQGELMGCSADQARDLKR